MYINLRYVAGKLLFQMGSDGHLGFMQITRVAQSCHLGNKAEFVLGPNYITNVCMVISFALQTVLSYCE